MGYRLGIDSGGTFTDRIGIDSESGNLVVAKTPSTPARPVDAIMNAITSSGAGPEALEGISIGTTVATNALLQRTGARGVLIGAIVTGREADTIEAAARAFREGL